MTEGEVQQQPAAAEGHQGEQGEGLLQIAMRFISYYMLIQFVLSFVFPSTKNQTEVPTPSSSAVVDGDSSNNRQQQPPASNAPKIFYPHWREHSRGVLSVFLVEDRSDHDALRDDAVRAAALPLHTFTNVRHRVEGEEPEQSHNVTLNLTDCARRNCSLYVHAMLSSNGVRPATVAIPFTRFELVRKSTKLRNLFDGTSSTPSTDETTSALPSSSLHRDDEGNAEKTEATMKPEDTRTSGEIPESNQLLATVTPGAVDSASPNRGGQEDGDRVIASIPPSILVNVIADWTRWDSKNIPPAMAPHIRPVLDDPLHAGQYPPILLLNEFWILDEYRTLFNESSAESVNVTITTSPLSLMKFLLYVSFEHQMESQKEWGLQTSKGMDEVKRMLIETEPWLLAVTLIVSLLHMLFEYLTFSSDVQFWKGRKNFRGLSLRSVALNCYFQTIIFLYLFDGNETSYTVLLPSGIGVLIEYWKLRKCLVIERIVHPTAQQQQQQRLASGGGGEDSHGPSSSSTSSSPDPGSPASPVPPSPKEFEEVVAPARWKLWKHWSITYAASYDSKTRTFDQQAMKYLMMIMFPSLVAYSIYSAMYDQHKGWYSFLIRCQVRFIYWFGFVQMCPQIFVNYQLKTVGQLPWKAFIYKTLNTFIDDLFAFVIKMPTMHRLAVFRDDIVFLILLYQRWIYPVDKSRSDVDGADDGVSEAEGSAAGDGAAAKPATAMLTASSSTSPPSSSDGAAVHKNDGADDSEKLKKE